MLRWRSIVAASKAISRRRLRPLGAGCVTLQQIQNSRHRHQHRSSGVLPVPWLLLAGAATVAVAGIHSEGDKPRCHYRRFDDFYKLLEKTSPIGMGAYGTVCAAAHRETGEVVAVKQIPRSAVSAKEVMSEVEILRVAGDHRHIVRLMDLFWDDDLWYVVMEMAHGGELFDRIVNKGLLSEHDTCKVMQDLLHAIEFLHMHNIVHGDIKPENIMIAEDSSTIDVRLGDFGTAFEVMGQKGRGGSADGAKLSGSSRMTVAYSPPEVLDQDGDDDVEVGPKADVWALGVLMYILIAGRHPFDMDPGADEDELQRHICRGEPDFSDPLWHDVSPAAIDLIKRMLSKDPTVRPTCTEALAHPWFEGVEQHSRATPAEACEAFHHFCEGRRRIKACLLAVMVGIIDTSGGGADVASGSSGGDTTSGFYEGRRALTRLGFGPHGIGSRTVACKLMDRLGKGYIDGDDLAAVMRAMGERLSQEDINSMLKAIDGDPLGPNPTGQITYDQMSRLVPPLCPARKYQPGEVVYREGERDDSFFLVKRGNIEFGIGSPAGEQVLQGLSAGDSFGEVELMQQPATVLPRMCSCRCAPDSPERCELLAVTHDLFALLTDVFSSVRGRIEAQTKLRLHLLAGEVLRRGFGVAPRRLAPGEAAFGGGGGGAAARGGGGGDACAVVVLRGRVAATWPDDAAPPPLHPPSAPDAALPQDAAAATAAARQRRRAASAADRTEILQAGDFCFCGDLEQLSGRAGERGADGVIAVPSSSSSAQDEGGAEVLVIPAEPFRRLMEQDNMAALRSYLFGVARAEVVAAGVPRSPAELAGVSAVECP